MTILKQTGERQVATTLDEIRADHRERYAWAAGRLGAGDRVLDAGCGVGYGSFMLGERANSVLGVDVSEDAVAFARRYFARDNVSHLAQDLNALSLSDRSPIDVVVAFEVIEHLIEPRLFLASIAALQVPGGRLYVSVPNEIRIQHTIELNPFHLRHYTPTEIRDLLKAGGYDVRETVSQEEVELTPGPGGRFLVIEAERSECAPTWPQATELMREALSAAAQQVVARAMVLSKAKKDVARLRREVQEAEAQRAVTLPPPPDETPELLRTVEAIGRRIESIDDSITAGLQQRLVSFEANDRTLRTEVSQLQHKLQVSEGERLRLVAGEQRLVSFETSDYALRTEISQLQHELQASEAERLRLVAAEQRLLSFETSDRALRTEISQLQHELQVSEGERLRLVAAEQRLVSFETGDRALRTEITQLQHQLQLSEGERLHLLTEVQRHRDQAAQLTEQMERASKLVKQRVKEVQASRMQTESAQTRLLAVAGDREELRRTNEELAAGLVRASGEVKSLRARQQGLVATKPVEPRPSVGLLLRTLKHRRLFVPYVLEAVRNTYRSKVSRRRARR